MSSSLFRSARSLAVAPSSRLLSRAVSSAGTKVVATIGPASENMPMLQLVADAGLDIMRINFSHGKQLLVLLDCMIAS